MGKEHTIILSSHILPEVADVCERVIIIDHGRIVAQDSLVNLQQGLGETAKLTVRIAGPEAATARALRAIEGVINVDSLGVRESGSYDYLITANKSADVRRIIFNIMGKAGTPILLMRYLDYTLEDIFLQLTGTAKEDF